ncbi:MAG: aldo/keto reductase [Thermodesulfobacteriota bacterium]
MIPRRSLGSTGLEVSILGLGGHVFPVQARDYYESFYGRRFFNNEAWSQRREIVAAALEAGLNLLAVDFDFEARAVGRILKETGGRDGVFITAVIDFRPVPGEAIKWSDLEDSIDRMLTSLQTERLELPQIRVTDRYLEMGLIEDMIPTLARLVEKGKILAPVFYGGDSDLKVLTAGLEKRQFPVVARAWGWLNPTVRDYLLPAVVTARAGFIGFVPFQKGWLFDCGREAGLSPADVARFGLSWALFQPGVTSVLCGAAGAGEIKFNARTAVAGLDSSFLEEMAGRLSATRTYGRFLSLVRQTAPHLVHDWRGIREACAA